MSVFAPVRSRRVDASGQTLNSLHSAEHNVRRSSRHGMSQRTQGVDPLPREGIFENKLEVLAYLPTRRVASDLRVLSEREDAVDHLQMSLGLHVPTHETKSQRCFAVTRDKARDDGVKRALARSHRVGMASRGGKSVATVLE